MENDEPALRTEARRWAQGWRRQDGHRCPIWAHYGEEPVAKELARYSGTAFVACEQPEREITPGVIFDAEKCAACRIWLAAFAVENPTLVMNVDAETRKNMGASPRQRITATDILGHWARVSGDAALVSAVERLATLASGVSPREPQPQH